MKLRSARKIYVFDLSPVLVFEILKYINPLLHYLVSKHYFHDNVINIDYDKRLPISLLLSLNNLEVLENFKAVLLSLKFRENLEKQIEMYGDYSTMMWFQDHDIIMSESALIAVAGRGDLGLFRAIINDYEGSRSRFRQDCDEILTDSYNKAAENGHLNILEYAISTDLLRITDNQSFDLMEIASQYGQLEILKWFYARINRNGAGRKIEFEIVFSSILGNQMHILEWIFELIEWDETQQQAAKDRENNFGNESMKVARASRHGNLSMVKFLIDKGFEYRHTVVTQAAAASGNLEVLIYLRSLDCPWSETIYLAAAAEGHLEILKWAESHGCPWDNSDLFPAAAQSSNRDVYQWLHDRQCPFKEEVSFHVACECGNFEFIKFARANGSTVMSEELLLDLIDCAADRGDLETIYWALDQSYGVMRIQNIIVAAATHCHMHILEWIERVGGIQVLIHWAINPAVIQGHVDVLKWVVRNGYKWDAKKDYQHYLTAIKNSNLQVLVWMNSCAPIFTTDTCFPSIYASQEGQFEIVKWLHENGCPCNQDSYHAARERRIEKWIEQQLYVERRRRRKNSLDIWT
jgi:ankyrin repeat protein